MGRHCARLRKGTAPSDSPGGGGPTISYAAIILWEEGTGKLGCYWHQNRHAETHWEIWEDGVDSGTLINQNTAPYDEGSFTGTSDTSFNEGHDYYARVTATGEPPLITGPWNFD